MIVATQQRGALLQAIHPIGPVAFQSALYGFAGEVWPTQAYSSTHSLFQWTVGLGGIDAGIHSGNEAQILVSNAKFNRGAQTAGNYRFSEPILAAGKRFGEELVL